MNYEDSVPISLQKKCKHVMSNYSLYSNLLFQTGFTPGLHTLLINLVYSPSIDSAHFQNDDDWFNIYSQSVSNTLHTCNMTKALAGQYILLFFIYFVYYYLFRTFFILASYLYEKHSAVLIGILRKRTDGELYLSLNLIIFIIL